MKLFKKVSALVLAAAISLSSFATAFAATQSPTTAPVANASATTVKSHTVSSMEAGTATLKAVNKTYKSVIINAVAVNGVKYKITKIAANAFNGSKATKVTLGANVKTISKNAFKGSKVKTIVLKNRKVTVKKGAFSGRNTKKMTIKVNCTKKQLAAVKKKLRAAGFKGTIKRL